MTGVCFYGNIQKAQVILACIQAAITGVAKDANRGHAASRGLLERYLAELEEIERDVVALINVARGEGENNRNSDNGSWTEDASDPDVHRT